MFLLIETLLSRLSTGSFRHSRLWRCALPLVTNELSRHSGSGRYATLLFAEYDTGERTLRYVNAGHNAPLPIGYQHNRGAAAISNVHRFARDVSAYLRCLDP
jgi:hypothetical protein